MSSTSASISLRKKGNHRDTETQSREYSESTRRRSEESCTSASIGPQSWEPERLKDAEQKYRECSDLIPAKSSLCLCVSVVPSLPVLTRFEHPRQPPAERFRGHHFQPAAAGQRNPA